MVLFLAWKAMVLKSSLQSRFTVEMMFWSGNDTLNSNDHRNPGICVMGGEERPAAAFGVMVTGAVQVVGRAMVAGCFCWLWGGVYEFGPAQFRVQEGSTKDSLNVHAWVNKEKTKIEYSIRERTNCHTTWRSRHVTNTSELVLIY